MTFLIITGVVIGIIGRMRAELTNALSLTVPFGATYALEAPNWAEDIFSEVAGNSNDYSDGGFSNSNYIHTTTDRNTLTLTVSNLPPHSLLELGMLMGQIQSLDPSRDGDVITIFVDGVEVFHVGLGFGSGGGYYEAEIQEFKLNGISANPDLLVAARTLVLDQRYDDRIYDLSQLNALQALAHTNSTAVIIIIASVNQAWSTEGYALDNLSVAVADSDSDTDGIPDWWEIKYFGGATNANPFAMAANDINNLRETYISGLNPTNPAARFEISNFGNSIEWDTASGRVYSVYWTSNLLENFQALETNVYGGSYTDILHGTDVKAFYKIGVRLE